MLIPILISAKDNASSALKSIAASFQSLTSSAENAAKAAGNVSIKETGAAKIAALREEINSSTQSLRTNSAAESLRASKASLGSAENLVGERRRQHELLNTEKSAASLAQAELRLAAARSKASSAGGKFDLNASKIELAELEKSNVGLNRISKMLGSVLPSQFGALAGSGGGAFSSIAGEISGADLAAGALVGTVGLGLVGAFMAAGAAASYLGDQFSKSVDRQKTLVSSAEPLVKNFGVSYEEADKNVAETQKRIAILGLSLPVSSEKINVIASAVTTPLAEMLKKAGMGIGDLARYQDTIASKGAILTAQTPGGTPDDISRIFDRLDTGTTAKGLAHLELYQRSPNLRAALEETFQKYGIKNTSELKASDKPQFMLDLFNSAVTDQQVNRLRGTVAAQLSQFTDRLFNPTTGIFGLEREMENKSGETHTVFTEMSRSLNILIGDGGILSNISNLLGLTGDPMKDLYNGIKGVNDWLESLNNFLKEFQKTPLNVQAAKGSAEASGKFFHGDLIGGIQSSWKVMFPSQPTPQGQPTPDAQPKFEGLNSRPSAMGFMPLQSAIQTEMRNKPTNSRLLIANDSEAVLTPQQLRSVSSPQQTVKTENRSLTLGAGAITIVANAQMNIEEMAQMLIERLDLEFNRSVTSLLA